MNILDDILKMKENIISENEIKHQKNIREKKIIMEKVDVKCCSPRMFRKRLKTKNKPRNKPRNKPQNKCNSNYSRLDSEEKDKRDVGMICGTELCVLCALCIAF